MSQAEAPSPAPRGKISVPSSRVRTSEQRAMILIRQHSMHFNEADTNNDNTMDYEEFVKSLPQHVRDSTPPDQLRTWFDMMDLDGSGEISRDEHLKWSLNAATVASGAGIEKVFQRYDRDGSGELSELEFARAARDMGLGDHAEHLFHSLPGSDNGSVSYLELLEGAKAGEGAAGGETDANNTLRDFLIAMAWDSSKEPDDKISTLGWSFNAETLSGLRTALWELIEAKGVKISQLFGALDTSNDYLLTRSEFVRGMRDSLGFQGDVELLRKAFVDIDDDCTARIGFDELTAWLNGRDTAKAGRLARVQHLTFRDESISAVEDAWDAPRLRSELRAALEELGEPRCKPIDLVDWLDPQGTGRIQRRDILKRFKLFVNNESIWYQKVRGSVEDLFEQLDPDHVAGRGKQNRGLDSDELLDWLCYDESNKFRDGGKGGTASEDADAPPVDAVPKEQLEQPRKRSPPGKSPLKAGGSVARRSRPRSASRAITSNEAQASAHSLAAADSDGADMPSDTVADDHSSPARSISQLPPAKPAWVQMDIPVSERAASNVRLLLLAKPPPAMRKPMAVPKSPPGHGAPYYRTTHGTDVSKLSHGPISMIARSRNPKQPTPTLSRPWASSPSLAHKL